MKIDDRGKLTTTATDRKTIEAFIRLAKFAAANGVAQGAPAYAAAKQLGDAIAQREAAS